MLDRTGEPTMQLLTAPRSQTLTSLFGLCLFAGMMATGYFYNLTFVQLGLIDLGERLVGLSGPMVARDMALLALLTCLVAISFGWWATRHGWGERFVLRLRLAFLVVAAQTLLTFLAPAIRSESAFLGWIVACSLTLGTGVPITFSLTIDLVPRRWRGEAAALVTAAAYLAANIVPASWSIEDFAAPLLWILPFGALALAILSFARLPLVERLARQSRLSAFHDGRYLHASTTASTSIRLRGLVLVMFAIFFVDSLGFLRLLDTPRFMESAWQSASFDTRLVIGVVHVLGALIGGVLYDALHVRSLFYWIFGIFALVHLMYTISLRVPGTGAPLAPPILYALAVSLYTVVNFAIWADFSTPKTIAMNAALGVALSGWTATFLSTALAIIWETNGMPLSRHLNIVDSLAMLSFLALLALAYIPRKGSRR